jgi:alpha-tubulin suppressor-like RCC1 family protein
MQRVRRAIAATALLGMTAGVITAAGAPAAALPPPPGGQDNKGVLLWGDNRFGQLGDGTYSRRTRPVEPIGLSSGVVDVAAGGRHTLVVRSSGKVMAFGSNSDGQLGIGTQSGSTVPAQVPDLVGVKRVSAGNAHSLALKSDGTVWAWGDNSRGQIGDESFMDRLTPVQVPGLTGVTQISAGGEFNLALRSDGSVMAWGTNEFGQLGDGMSGDKRHPVLVAGLANIIKVAAGSFHGLALRSDGVAFAWGNTLDQGTDDGSDHAIPQRVTILRNVPNVTDLAAGTGFSMAVGDTRAMWWGLNCIFQEPDSDGFCSPGDDLHPMYMTQITQVAAGRAHRVAVMSNGSVWAWGSNGGGQLGDGTTTYRADPVLPLVAGSRAVLADAGDDHTVVLAKRPPVVNP